MSLWASCGPPEAQRQADLPAVPRDLIVGNGDHAELVIAVRDYLDGRRPGSPR
jgi:hypothetical protein